MQKLSPNSRARETKKQNMLEKNSSRAGSFLPSLLALGHTIARGRCRPPAHAVTSGQVPEHGSAEKPAGKKITLKKLDRRQPGTLQSLSNSEMGFM